MSSIIENFEKLAICALGEWPLRIRICRLTKIVLVNKVIEKMTKICDRIKIY